MKSYKCTLHSYCAIGSSGPVGFIKDINVNEIRQASRKDIEEVVCNDQRKNKNGYLKSNSFMKAEILNDQFKSVFTEEDTTTIPTKGACVYPDMPSMTVNVPGVQNLWSLP